jgi:hypothetical protein
MDANHLVGRQVHVHASELFGVTVVAVVRALDLDAQLMLLEFVPSAQSGLQTYPFAIVRPRLERDDFRTLVDSGVLGCGITCIPKDRYNPAKPFDLSWWRGGGAAIGDLVL